MGEFIKIIAEKKAFFDSGKTQDISFRRESLKKLKKTIKKNESIIIQALKDDLGRHAVESYTSELGFIYQEINYALGNIKKWTAPAPLKTPLIYFGAKCYLKAEPYGTTLIIGTWNYPFTLTILPLVNAVTAGNCAVIKPSEYAPQSAKAITRIIADTFPPDFVNTIEADAEKTLALAKEKFDHIFFTGSSRMAQSVMSQAAGNLTPVTLELGGKNPCLVHKDADVDLAAKKIAWAKFINAGQTCVTCDYILAHNAVKQPLIEAIKKYIKIFYGPDIKQSQSYGRIINEYHFDRLLSLLRGGKIIEGGRSDKNDLYIAPTIIDNIFSMESTVMEEEIFGPILPIVEYEDIRRALAIIKSKPKPLAVYLFTGNPDIQDYILTRTSSGGACVNDIMLQCSMPAFPFGGVGKSGMGRYHGKSGFENFSNMRTILKAPGSFDVKLRYPPYKKSSLGLLRIFMG